MSESKPIGEDVVRALEVVCETHIGARITSLEGIAPGLGTRAFVRVGLAPKPGRECPERLIARIDAPEDPALRPAGVAPEPPLEPLRSFLESHAIPVPALFGEDPEHGIVLLEDVGPLNLERAVETLSDESRRSLYREACLLIPALQALHATADEIPAFGRSLDAALFESKADRVVRWCLPPLLGRDANADEEAIVRAAFREVAAHSLAAPQRLSHRDYKAQNLHLRRDARGHLRIVMIDLQGMFLAPPEYDLVCLLRDSHVWLPEEEVTAHLSATRSRLPDAPDPQRFDERFTLLTVTRVAKDCAHYIHAATTRGDARYLPLVPTALENLRRASARAAAWAPAFEALAGLIGRLAIPASWPTADPSRRGAAQ